MGNTLCGSVVVIAIPNAHTQDDATDSLSLPVASYPGRFVGGGKTAWYRLFANARNTPRFVVVVFLFYLLPNGVARTISYFFKKIRGVSDLYVNFPCNFPLYFTHTLVYCGLADVSSL